jgi:hypothetical protein
MYILESRDSSIPKVKDGFRQSLALYLVVGKAESRANYRNLSPAYREAVHFDRPLNGKDWENCGVEVVKCRMLRLSRSEEDIGGWLSTKSCLIIKIEEGS